jgi:hydrogenase maturation protease
MSTVVIGIGNEWRQDDGVGRAVARALAGAPGITVRQVPNAGVDLIDAWGGFSTAILVDAMRSGLPPGSLRCFKWQEMPAGAFGLTTHAIELRGALQLAQALGRLPARVLVCGIEGAAFGDGTGLSPAVASAVPAAAREILALAGNAKQTETRPTIA